SQNSRAPPSPHTPISTPPPQPGSHAPSQAVTSPSAPASAPCKSAPTSPSGTSPRTAPPAAAPRGRGGAGLSPGTPRCRPSAPRGLVSGARGRGGRGRELQDRGVSCRGGSAL